VRDAIADWLRTHHDEVTSTVDAFLQAADPELKDMRLDLIQFFAEEAVPRIDEIASDGRLASHDLSQRLAESGLLPMFGFPTRMRTLFHYPPRRANPWPPRHVIDRDSSIAISQWAPGSEVVKDKGIHRCIGIASFMPQGNQVISDPDPFGFRQEVGYCSECGALDVENPDHAACPVCAAPLADGEPGYRRFTIAQPIGYRTDFRIQDYRDWFEWTASGSRPRMSASGALDTHTIGNARIERGVTDIYEINDNNGQDFVFAPATDGQGWICNTLDVRLPPTDNSRAEPVALAASKSTDVLVLGVDGDRLPEGVSLQPTTAARRGAWYSIGFLLRGAAARLLEVQTNELEVGLRAVRINGVLTAQVFLSDTLANGAGYCTHLGDPAVFADLLTETAGWIDELKTHTVSEQSCDSACYDCLKDYRNMHYHGLLDWRLAADMLALLEDGRFDPTTFWGSHGAAIIAAFAAQLDGFDSVEYAGLPAARNGDITVIGVHPLEEKDPAYVREATAEAIFEARKESTANGGPRQVILQDFFDLLRRPGWVYAKLWD
jgi:DEAD/DEAH box helicase domain-containing protein